MLSLWHMKWMLAVVVTVVVLIVGFFALNAYIYEEKQVDAFSSYKDAEYLIEGQRIKLMDGISEIEAAPGSVSKVVTRFFGNELFTDLNSDGRQDVVFLVTQEPGSTGTYFYAVAALNTARGYVGSDGYLLGDRIAPQSTEESRNSRHVDVIVVNYADRMPSDPMAAAPSVGKSAYLKLDPHTMQWAIVEPNFEGESR